MPEAGPKVAETPRDATAWPPPKSHVPAPLPPSIAAPVTNCRRFNRIVFLPGGPSGGSRRDADHRTSCERRKPPASGRRDGRLRAGRHDAEATLLPAVDKERGAEHRHEHTEHDQAEIARDMAEHR